MNTPTPTQFPATPALAKDRIFNADTTQVFQVKMKKAPVWFCSFMAGNSREKTRLRNEFSSIKDALPLLMKQRNGGKWSAEDKVQLRKILRSASSVSPYLFILAIPGSVLFLPFLAWFLDGRRKGREDIIKPLS